MFSGIARPCQNIVVLSYTKRLQRLIKVVISDPRLPGFCDTLAKPWRGTCRNPKAFDEGLQLDVTVGRVFHTHQTQLDQPTTQTLHSFRPSHRTPPTLCFIIRARLRVHLTADSSTLDCSRHARLALTMPRLKRSATEAQLDVPTEPELAPEAAQTLKDLRNMWEFASLMQYIFLFGNVVKIDEDFDIEV
jgi:hypothetical protein